MNYPMLVDGELLAGDTPFDVLEPATGEPLATCGAASAQQLDHAVAAAQRAFQSWRAVPFAERQAVLGRAAKITRDHVDELSTLLTREQGKPIGDARMEVLAAADIIDYFASLPSSVTTPPPTPTGAQLLREPLGVVGAIVPWNFPIALLAFKLPGALLMGNTIVVKPAPTTPLTTLRWAALVKDVFPRGVINVVADAGDVGPLLTAHPGVRKISFTGSTAIGREVMRSAAATLKRITLELGGNDPAVVLPDADPDAVAAPIFAGAFMNNGQTCSAIKRVYVHDSIYDQVVARLAEIAEGTVMGNGLQPGVQLGPLQNARQFAFVRKLLAQTGGRVVAGGTITDGPGYFIRPTVVADVEDGDCLVDEEQFGPVLPVVRYTDVDKVVAIANASPYGLGASVWGTDHAAAVAVAKRLEAGSVWVNKHFPVSPDTPFGGARQSGIGAELGEQGLSEFTQLKVMVV